MDNNELYTLLELPEEVIYKLNIYSKKRKNTFKIDINDFMKNDEMIQRLDQLIKDEVGQDIDGMKTLYEQLNIARQSFEEYQKRGIPISIFIDTMKFCTRFLTEYYKTYTYYRFVWGWWFPRQLCLREFRIGDLEYEYCEEKYINIHIPSDANLSKPSILKSLSEFKDFCNKYYPEWKEQKIQCESWLLSPALKDILSNPSNILEFQKLFDITEIDYESMAVLDWVFPGFHAVSEKLPEKTSLQRNMKKYLLEGKKIGWAKGILQKDYR